MPPYRPSVIALRKWAAERLEETTAPDGRRAFVFRYDGSTCRDGGTPFSVRMHLEVEPQPGGQAVLRRFGAEPVEGETGHEQMCSGGLNAVDSMVRGLGVLDRTLTEILEEDIAVVPAGCFCDGPKTRHKVAIAVGTVAERLAGEKGD